MGKILAVVVLLLLVVGCKKTNTIPAQEKPEENSSNSNNLSTQTISEISLEQVKANFKDLEYYENEKPVSKEIAAIITNGGFFKKELTNGTKSYSIQIAKYKQTNQITSIVILSKKAGEQFEPTMVVPLHLSSVPSFYEKDGQLFASWKHETDWGAEVKIENDKLIFVNF